MIRVINISPDVTCQEYAGVRSLFCLMVNETYVTITF